MADYLDFSSDKMDIFALLIDSSGSMEDDSDNVETGLEMYKKSFENFPEINSIAVSISRFNDNFYPGNFQHVSELDTSYLAIGTTALYYSIVKGAELLKNYMEKVTELKGCTPRATFILFSDGESCCDRMEPWEAKEAIANLNHAGINTVFVAFGEGIKSGFGEELGFISTKDVDDRETLVQFLGVELSKSCKEQSKSMKSLGSDFFSKATGESTSASYSTNSAQALEDNSWFDEI